ncbi:DUF6500 family protein [Yokenella regensburgei]|uniref:DUF6500 family protein n=1 Tax=Yokenella regensburgei TaxID=158877 RepID=UPI003F5CCD33
MIRTFKSKITAKGAGMELSFYAFFANKIDVPELLMEVAHRWIMEMKLNYLSLQCKQPGGDSC